MVNIIARLYLLSEGKDQRYSSYKGDNTDQTNLPHTYTQLSSATVDESIRSTNSIDLTLDLDNVIPLKDTRSTKPIKSAKSRKLVTSSKITKANKPPTSLTCLFYYGNPKRRRT